MENTAKIVGAEIGREELEKQTQARVCARIFYFGENREGQGWSAVKLGNFTDIIIDFLNCFTS